ncbi:uncharacterized protein LOC111341874 isoform X2 [Stylophora pistillata]|uniref:uncharacterized protein LOC111341874 isoform X2 n=1 Tax=Stylophora pistillata TaxID=50429 RepID=UPI000C03C88D|nr:uncharacterized protein LOC111341874 isoform X2 [Stylophora pistillata]
MAPAKETSVYICNCDKLCDLNEVEELFKAVKKKLAVRTSFQIEKHYFSGGQISDMVNKTIPKLKMDYAVFVVHADECCLSFSEDSGHGKIYEALKKRTGSGGDVNYRDKDEENRSILSRQARDTVLSHQLRPEFIDGRKSFIFSWNKKHRAIHENALKHYFDPSKKGQKFMNQLVAEPARIGPELEEETLITSLLATQSQSPEISLQVPSDIEEDTKIPVDEQQAEIEDESEPSALQVSASHFSTPHEQSRFLLLETRIRYGKISYESKDVVTWVESWQPSERDAEDLEQKCKSTPVATLKMYGDKSGELHRVVVTPKKSRCSIS